MSYLAQAEGLVNRLNYLLISQGLFTEKEKRCRKGSSGTGDLLYVQQYIHKEKLNETKKKVSMAWIDFKNSYDLVPQSWIIDCHKMYKISYQVIRFIEERMKNWRVELIAGVKKSSAEGKIQRGIFQGALLSPLLFVIAMILLNPIFRKCPIGYKLPKSQEKINYLMYMSIIKLFAKNEEELETLIYRIWHFKKCTMLIMQNGKCQITEGIELPNIKKIRTLGEKVTNKYWRYGKQIS